MAGGRRLLETPRGLSRVLKAVESTAAAAKFRQAAAQHLTPNKDDSVCENCDDAVVAMLAELLRGENNSDRKTCFAMSAIQENGHATCNGSGPLPRPFSPKAKKPSYAGRQSRAWHSFNKTLPWMLALGLVVAIITLSYYDHIVWQRVYLTPAWPAPPWLFWRERICDKPYPRILLWNRFVQPYSALDRDTSSAKFLSSEQIRCSSGGNRYVKCEVTDNRSMLMQSDAVVFQAERLTPLDSPRTRSQFQLWVLWAQMHLTPMNGDVVIYKDRKSDSFLRALGLLFNWTMGRREDADIVIPYMSWRCGVPGNQSMAPPIEMQPATTRQERRAVGWILGRCEERSYTDMLSLRPSNVTDVHGDFHVGSVRIHLLRRCGDGHCLNRAECVKHIAERFKFIVVSMKPDCFHSAYEVIYEAFKYNLVPIVLTPPNTTLDVPEHSVVSSANLQGPGQLAAHLNTLLKSPDKYNTYFVWKRHCSLVPHKSSFCSLCHALWETPLRKRAHHNSRDWWIKPAMCTEQNKLLYSLDAAFGFVTI